MGCSGDSTGPQVQPNLGQGCTSANADTATKSGSDWRVNIYYTKPDTQDVRRSDGVVVRQIKASCASATCIWTSAPTTMTESTAIQRCRDLFNV